MYEKVCGLCVNINVNIDNKQFIQLMYYINSHIQPLEAAYETYIIKPLSNVAGKKKVQDCLPQMVEYVFMKLINKDVSWYSLFITINFEAGNTLPFSTKLFCLPAISPDIVANSNLQRQTSQLVKTLGGEI